MATRRNALTNALNVFEPVIWFGLFYTGNSSKRYVQRHLNCFYNYRPFLKVWSLSRGERLLVSFVMSARPSVRMCRPGSYWTDFREI